VRVQALREGKLVYMAVPKLADPLPFFRLDPAELGEDAERLAAHRDLRRAEARAAERLLRAGPGRAVPARLPAADLGGDEARIRLDGDELNRWKGVDLDQLDYYVVPLITRRIGSVVANDHNVSYLELARGPPARASLPRSSHVASIMSCQ